MKRLSFLIYEFIPYAISLGTFLYAVGFVSLWGAPKHTDGEMQSLLGFALLISTGLLLYSRFKTASWHVLYYNPY